MRYVSCFSGIGGLEASMPPELFCEANPYAATVLSSPVPGFEVWPDIWTLRPRSADVADGGWPCQDLSIADQQQGLSGLRSTGTFGVTAVEANS
jgi:site-specific DNA-cytosine methylase